MSKLQVYCEIGCINVIDMKWYKYVHLLNTGMKLKIPGKNRI